MSTAVFIPYENRLAAVVQTPGGMKVEAALRQADDSIAAMRDEGLVELDRLLAEIERLSAEAAAAPEPANMTGLYQTSNEALAVAGIVGLSHLVEACRSLCELVDGLRARGAWNGPAVQVHLAALPLLRRDESGQDLAAVVDGLRQVVTRVIV